METFNNFSVSSTENYPLISQYSFITKPQIAEKLFDVRPGESDLGTFMEMGLMKRYKGEEIVHNEANKLVDAPFVASSTTVANVYGTGTFAGIPSMNYIVLATQSHSPSTGAGANKFSSPRVGQLIQFKNLSVWRIVGKDETTPGAHKLWISRITAATAPYNTALASTITNNAGTYGGDQFSIFASAFEEATRGMQKGLVPTFTSYKNYFQSFSERYDVTDWASQTETYPMKWNGKPVNFVYVKGLDDTEKRFMMAETLGLFITPKDDGGAFHINSDNTTSVVTTTHAFMPQMELQAQKLLHGGTSSLAQFDTIVRLKKKQYQEREAIMWYGYEYGFMIKDMVNDFGTESHGLVYDRKALDLGFNTFEIANHKFNAKEMEILGHADTTAIAGFPYPENFIVQPMAKVRDAKDKNALHDSMTIMYKEMEGRGARGHYKIWNTGANSDAGTDDQLINRVHMASRKGTQVFGASRFILGKRA